MRQCVKCGRLEWVNNENVCASCRGERPSLAEIQNRNMANRRRTSRYHEAILALIDFFFLIIV